MFPETDLIGGRYIPRTEEFVRNKLPELPKMAKEYTYRLLPGATKPKVGDFAVVANSNGISVCISSGCFLSASPFTWDAGQKFFACSGKSGLLCIRRTDLCNITGCFIGGQLYFSAPDRGMSEDP